MSDTFGRLEENVTSTDAIAQIFNLPTSTDGSGLDPELKSARRHKETLATGVTPVDSAKLNQTTEKQHK